VHTRLPDVSAISPIELVGEQIIPVIAEF
jgi:hypothetical protein